MRDIQLEAKQQLPKVWSRVSTLASGQFRLLLRRLSQSGDETVEWSRETSRFRSANCENPMQAHTCQTHSFCSRVPMTDTDRKCDVCHLHVPKYRCPTCSTVRYCSIACYKTHKGVRLHSLYAPPLTRLHCSFLLDTGKTSQQSYGCSRPQQATLLHIANQCSCFVK